MNREAARKLLPVIEAYADGKAIQYLNSGGIWCDGDKDDSGERGYEFYSPERYRIKPEPEVIYVNKYRSGSTVHYQSKEEATKSVFADEDYEYTAKKFIAVEE